MGPDFIQIMQDKEELINKKLALAQELLKKYADCRMKEL